MFKPDEAKSLLEQAYRDGGLDRWMAAVDSILVDLVTEHAKTRMVTAAAAREVQSQKPLFDVLQAQFAGAQQQVPAAAAAVQAPAAPATPVGSDGAPLTTDQAAAEAMMDAAAGPRDGEVPVAQPGQPVTIAQRLGVPPKGGLRPGAAPAAAVVAPAITGDQSDADQARIEAMMNGAAGPRQ
jgi:hypothetical protein